MEHYFTNNDNLKSEIKTIDVNIFDKKLTFKSDNGVFSKNKIDYASKFLTETYLELGRKNISKVLDIGCGYGFIGITLSNFLNVSCDMVDINKRALHLCTINSKENNCNCKIFESNIYEKVSDKYDLIITNPPIRVGNETLYKFLLEAKNYLKEDGELWFVISKDQGAKSVNKKMNFVGKCQVVKKSKGFYVFLMKFC